MCSLNVYIEEREEMSYFKLWHFQDDISVSILLNVSTDLFDFASLWITQTCLEWKPDN